MMKNNKIFNYFTKYYIIFNKANNNVKLGRWGGTVSGKYQGYDCAFEFRYENKKKNNK